MTQYQNLWSLLILLIDFFVLFTDTTFSLNNKMQASSIVKEMTTNLDAFVDVNDFPLAQNVLE